jgi:hypothetical protein
MVPAPSWSSTPCAEIEAKLEPGEARRHLRLMDPINPWLDAAEVRRLAERLMRPVREPAVTIADAGFDEAFVGFACSFSTAKAR